jgi:hypothetical protein
MPPEEPHVNYRKFNLTSGAPQSSGDKSYSKKVILEYRQNGKKVQTTKTTTVVRNRPLMSSGHSIPTKVSPSPKKPTLEIEYIKCIIKGLRGNQAIVESPDFLLFPQTRRICGKDQAIRIIRGWFENSDRVNSIAWLWAICSNDGAMPLKPLITHDSEGHPTKFICTDQKTSQVYTITPNVKWWIITKK